MEGSTSKAVKLFFCKGGFKLVPVPNLACRKAKKLETRASLSNLCETLKESDLSALGALRCCVCMLTRQKVVV